jgi:hypothetical protein
MAYINGYGQLMNDHFPVEDLNGHQADPPDPYPQTPHNPPRLPSRAGIRHDVQHCPRGYWATKEGALIRIRAMSDRHIANSMALLERKARGRARLESWRAINYARNAPEMAAEAANDAAEELEMLADNPYTNLRELARLVWPKYKELEAEWTKRVEALCDV